MFRLHTQYLPWCNLTPVAVHRLIEAMEYPGEGLGYSELHGPWHLPIPHHLRVADSHRGKYSTREKNKREAREAREHYG